MVGALIINLCSVFRCERFCREMDPSTLIKGKVHLVKIKESESFGAEDLLWGICLADQGLLDFMGFQGLAKRVNHRGFFAPILSRTCMKWGDILELVKRQEMGKIGSPITLFESPHSFKEMADFAYDMRVLTDPEGQAFLNDLTGLKVEETAKKGAGKGKSKGGKGAVKKVDRAEDVPGQSRQERLALAKRNAQMVVAEEKCGVSLDMNEIRSQSLQLHLAGIGVGLGQGQAQLVSGHPDTITTNNDVLIVNVDTGLVQREEVVVATPPGQSSVNIEEIMESDTDDSEEEPIGDRDNSIGIGDGTEMDLGEIDRVFEGLQEAESVGGTWEECKKRCARYKSLTISLRKNVDELKKANQELVRAATVHQKQMREYKAYAAEEVIDGIKPSLAPVVAATKKLDTIKDGITALEENITGQVRSNTVEMKEISEEVCSVKEAGEKGIAGVLRTLSGHGLYDRSDSLDIPSAISEILRIVRSITAPSTPLLDDTNNNIGIKDIEKVDKSTAVQLDKNGSLTVLSNPVSSTAKEIEKEATTFQSKENRKSGEVKSSKIFRPWGGEQDKDTNTSNPGLGLLPTPLHFKHIEESYLGNRNQTPHTGFPPKQVTPLKQACQVNGTRGMPERPVKMQHRDTVSLPWPVPSMSLKYPAPPPVNPTPAWTVATQLQAFFQPPTVPKPILDKASGSKHTPKTSYQPGQNSASKVQSHIPPPASNSEVTENKSQLTDETLQHMGYKRVHGYIVRAEQTKPKKSRWS